MTFLPEFVDYTYIGVVFADVAGQNDTSGQFIEFLNVFIIKQMFLQSKRVKFIIPITYN